jgi:hypothetical protein
MEMKKINSGKLRAIGYDARARSLQVQLDNIQEEFAVTQVTSSAPAGKNPLDDLFGKE